MGGKTTTIDRVGVWIDHAEAHIVRLLPQRRHAVTTIESGVESHRKATGQSGAPLPGHLGGNTESRDEHRRRGELAEYYDEVAEALRGAGSIVIVGPGEAPGELKARLVERDRRTADRVIGVHALGRLTEAQLAAEVRAIFAATEAS